MTLHDFYDPSIYAAKAAVVLIFLAIAYRLLGKRDVGQFNLYDLVTVIALSNAVQNAMTAGRGDLATGLSAAFSLLAVGYLVSRVFIDHPVARRLACGVPVLLLSDGHVLTDRLKREHVSIEELDAVIRTHGLESKSEVALAVLEVDGSISIVPKDDQHKIDPTLD
jgi:uncharacterized membrane protein YcaP (DUF421 family)